MRHVASKSPPPICTSHVFQRSNLLVDVMGNLYAPDCLSSDRCIVPRGMHALIACTQPPTFFFLSPGNATRCLSSDRCTLPCGTHASIACTQPPPFFFSPRNVTRYLSSDRYTVSHGMHAPIACSLAPTFFFCLFLSGMPYNRHIYLTSLFIY